MTSLNGYAASFIAGLLSGVSMTFYSLAGPLLTIMV
jgi:hypothetical protein